jgi:hypothetical protein
VSFLFQLANSSSCGSGTIPFSFEALADVQPLLGCFRPACFGWSADSKTVGSSINFTLINNRLDGYIHESNDDIPKEISAEDAQYFKPQLAVSILFLFDLFEEKNYGMCRISVCANIFRPFSIDN